MTALRSALLLFSAALAATACGAPEAPPRTPTAPAFAYVSATLPGQPVSVHALDAGSTVFVTATTRTPSGLRLSALALQADGEGRSPVVPLASGLAARLGDPLAAGGSLVAGGLREGPHGPSLEVVRWTPGAPVDRLATCPVPAVAGLLAIEDGELLVVFEDEAGALRGFRLLPADPTCPEPDATAVLSPGPLPPDYRLDWLDGQLAVSGQWGDTMAIRLFGPRFEPLRHLRLASGAAVQTSDLSFVQARDGTWSVVYAGRIDGARDVYQAALGQLVAGPLDARRVIATAEWEQRPSLTLRHGVTVAHWVVESTAGDQWIEHAGVLSPQGAALPGGDVVWRRSREPGAAATSLWTDLGLLRIAVAREGSATILTVSPFRPGFW